MSRSMTCLRRALLGFAFLGSLGFGATQAFGTPQQVTAKACPDIGADYYYASCGYGCPGNRGYCAEGGICRCGYIP